MERINCTIDELAEALAAVIGNLRKPHDVTVSWNQLASATASFLNADRLPEPEPPDGTPIEEIEWWEE